MAFYYAFECFIDLEIRELNNKKITRNDFILNYARQKNFGNLTLGTLIHN